MIMSGRTALGTGAARGIGAAIALAFAEAAGSRCRVDRAPRQDDHGQPPQRLLVLQGSEVAPTAVLLASAPGGNLGTGPTLGPNSGDVVL
jgi:NAD(P)-dependent dehydrogenase (short-subunit alcohol dehydrogenase family)